MRYYEGFRLTVLLLAASTAALADPPDIDLNPVTGFPEALDLAIASSHRVRHTIDMGASGRTSSLISSGAGESPRLAITANGNSWGVWWRDASIDEIRCAVRDLGTGAWTAEAVVSDTEEGSRYPEIVPDGSTAWIAYEVAGSGETHVAIVGITDDAEPIGPRQILGTTTFSGDVDVTVSAESGFVWASWVDDASDLAWSAWDVAEEEWSVPLYEPYASTSKDEAREVIRAIVLEE